MSHSNAGKEKIRSQKPKSQEYSDVKVEKKKRNKQKLSHRDVWKALE